MPRYRLIVEYDGGAFHGWQRQAGVPTVQQAVEEAIERFAGHPVRLGVAGRTDAGVHATGQVAHLDLVRDWEPAKVRDATNAHLRPARVAIIEVERAPSSFDARRSAVGRRYLYRILDRRAPSALDADRHWHVPMAIDLERMQAAADRLVGHHDFTTFRAMECQAASPVKTLDVLKVERAGLEVHVHAAARSFLHNQVRSMVGAIVKVGIGRWEPAEITRILEARDRQACPGMAPPHGLYLTGVLY
jgi:tRNA pseudouridine38-40 synthase